MRRKRDRSANVKAKVSPEKKVEKIKRTRSKRRKQSSSTENESSEEGIAVSVSEKLNDPGQNVEQMSNKKETLEESQDQVWQVKTAEVSGDGGEIQKLKICLTRPPSTPERGDRSPRSKRKHSRTASLSESPNTEVPDEKKKNKHRSKRSACDTCDISEKNNDTNQNEPECDVPTENTIDESVPCKDTQEPIQKNAETLPNEVIPDLNKGASLAKDLTATNEVIPEFTLVTVVSNDVKLNDNRVTNLSNEVNPESTEVTPSEEIKAESSVAVPKLNEERAGLIEVKIEAIDVEVESDKEINDSEVVVDSTENVETKKSDNILTTDPSSEPSNDVDISTESIQEKQIDSESSEKVDPEREISMSIDKSEILEIHAEDDSRGDISGQGVTDSQKDDVIEDQEPQAAIIQEAEDKVSKTEDEKVESIIENTEPPQNEMKVTINETDVVAQSENIVKKTFNEPLGEKSTEVPNKILECSLSSQSNNEGNGHLTITINRKRRWGSRPNKLTSQKSITISTDVLKEIIPDVKPVEFEEVIEEKKLHKRVEVVEKIERPILPKIVIDNTENIEHNKKPEDIAVEKVQVKETTNLTSSRKISIVKDSDNIAIIRPPSPPKHKHSNILFITNLVRPFTLSQLRNLLQRTGRITENGFWIDRIKSKCFVIYENEDQAIETRHALHGVTWPVSNPKTLHVDFSTQEQFDQAKVIEESESAQNSTLPGTVEDWLREQDMKRERGDMEKPWERKTTREWDLGKNEKNIDSKEKEKPKRDDRSLEKRRNHTPERSPEPAKKFKKKEEAPAKLLDDLFRKTKTTPCIYWLPLSAETIAIKEEQRRQHMAEHERRLQELRRGTHRNRH